MIKEGIVREWRIGRHASTVSAEAGNERRLAAAATEKTARGYVWIANRDRSHIPGLKKARMEPAFSRELWLA